MTRINTTGELYAEVDRLIANLRSVGRPRLADVLNVRVHEVAWTSGSELMEELEKVLVEALQPTSESLEPRMRQDIENILEAISRFTARSVGRRRFQS